VRGTRGSEEDGFKTEKTTPPPVRLDFPRKSFIFYFPDFERGWAAVWYCEAAVFGALTRGTIVRDRFQDATSVDKPFATDIDGPSSAKPQSHLDGNPERTVENRAEREKKRRFQEVSEGNGEFSSRSRGVGSLESRGVLQERKSLVGQAWIVMSVY